MGQLNSIDLPEHRTHDATTAVPSKRRWWLWVLVVGVLAFGGWYYRNSWNASQAAATTAAPGAAGKGRGGFGTVTAFNTVTVRSRVDGQLVSVAFKEGQFVHQGDLLAQIDPRPFQVQLEQALGQLAKDQAQRKDAEVNLERYKLLFKEGVIPQQQLDTQGALEEKLV